MLDHEENVKEHADTAKTQLHNVALQTRPFIFTSPFSSIPTKHSAVNKELKNGKHTTGEIKENVVDRPAHRSR